MKNFKLKFSVLSALLVCASLCHAGIIIQLETLGAGDGTKLLGAALYDSTGKAVAGLGDFNDDGIDDVLVGAPGADPGDRALAGSAYVVFGGDLPAVLSLSTIDGNNGIAFHGVQEYDLTGRAVAGVGDVNGDGIMDLAIGARRPTPYIRDEAYIIFGSGAGFASPVELDTLPNALGTVLMGVDTIEPRIGLGAAGDFNGDGIDDFTFGAARAGKGWVLLGRESAFPGLIDLGTLDPALGLQLGGESVDETSFTIRYAGDLNADGYDDVVLRPGYSGPGYIVFGRPGPYGTMDLEAGGGSNVVRLSNLQRTHYGTGAGPAGDVNGDGIDDLIVGAADPSSVFYPGGLGEALVVYGRLDWPGSIDMMNFDASEGVRFSGVDIGAGVGISVDGGSDFNGDGLSDLLVGAEDYSYHSGTSTGRDSFLLFGAAGGLTNPLDVSDLNGRNGLIFRGGSLDDVAGSAIRFAGDVNNDGISDVIIGARFADDRGAAYLVYGNAPPRSDRGSVGRSELGLLARSGDEPGMSVAELLGEHYIDPSEPMAGVAFTENQSPLDQGAWQYKFPGGSNWVAFSNTLSDSQALLLSPDSRIRFDPAPGFSGKAAPLLARFWDGRWHGSFFDTVDTTYMPSAVSGYGQAFEISTPHSDAIFLDDFD